jgi:uncharacterized phage protein (TIGR01671 family)
MREALFRGKTANGDWVYGNLVKAASLDYSGVYHYIIVQQEKSGKSAGYVISETVGQYTGLCDKNGNKIFEDDILEFKCSDTCAKECVNISSHLVVWNDDMARFELKPLGEQLGMENDEMDKCYVAEFYRVIGNIHDNPELVGGGRMKRLTQWEHDENGRFAIMNENTRRLGFKDSIVMITEKLAEYEDLEEQGLLIRLDDTSYSTKLAIIDEVSEWLQNNGFEDASKAVDCHWEL